MMIPRGDGTYDGGFHDVIMILHDAKTGRFHAAFFEEHPWCPDSGGSVRLKSKMHHTEGSPTLEGAQEHAKKLAESIHLPPENIWTDKPQEGWDAENMAVVWMFPDWRK